MNARNRILVFRFSAMGDVAMSAAVLREFCQQNQQLEVVMVTRPFFKPFFEDIDNLSFHPLEISRHKGISGLFTLFRELQAYQPIAIADLHNNLRSAILSGYFRFTKIPIVKVNKGRTEKKALTRKRGKVLKPLKSTIQHYEDVFNTLGFSLTLKQRLSPQRKPVPLPFLHLFEGSHKITVGVSPFAQHTPKVYPFEKMEVVIRELSHLGFQLLIFGGGKDEKLVAEEWSKRFRNVESLIGKMTLHEELAVISNLNMMLSMDSAGMHLASLMGIEVMSIWGATHPYAGFLGYGQREEDAIQIDLYCRPCSTYGNKPCYRGDHACMHNIDPGIIIARVKEKLNHAQKSFPN